MTHLAKLTFKTVDRSTKRDPIIARRDKLLAGLKEQKLVHAAALKKEDHRVERHCLTSALSVVRVFGTNGGLN
jgi:hypothetical protein